MSGYSEPGAGSDLAGLQTRAVDMGDSFVINGQKVWTSGAQFAQWIVLLARTDPDAPKHQGISYFLLSMKTPGVTVALVLMNGHRHFNECSLRMSAPRENLLGPKNEGWKVAITTLMFERSFAGGGSYSAQVRRLAALAKQVQIDGRPAWEQGWVRQKLAQFAIECEALKYTAQRNLTRQLKGQPPGPERSMLKLCGSELGVRIANFATELLGSYALLENPTESFLTRRAGSIASARASTLSLAAPAKFNTTLWASVCSGCPRVEDRNLHLIQGIVMGRFVMAAQLVIRFPAVAWVIPPGFPLSRESRPYYSSENQITQEL